MKHPAVAMSAVVGIPIPFVPNRSRSWIVLRPGFAPNDALAREIQEFVKVQPAAHEYPRFVQFAESLPMTATGKVLRRELRALGVGSTPLVVPAPVRNCSLGRDTRDMRRAL